MTKLKDAIQRAYAATARAERIWVETSGPADVHVIKHLTVARDALTQARACLP